MCFKKTLQVLGLLTMGASLALAGCGSAAEQECRDECSQGEQRCAQGQEAYETCGQYDDDKCLEWGGLVQCPDSETCTAGSCEGTHGGLVLTGELLPASGLMIAGDLQLKGLFSKDFAHEQSKAGSMTLEHTGFTSR